MIVKVKSKDHRTLNEDTMIASLGKQLLGNIFKNLDPSNVLKR